MNLYNECSYFFIIFQEENWWGGDDVIESEKKKKREFQIKQRSNPKNSKIK